MKKRSRFPTFLPWPTSKPMGKSWPCWRQANAIPSFIFNKKSADTFKKYSYWRYSTATLHTHIINPKMTLWIVIIAPPVQWGSHPSTKSPSTIERFRIPLQSKRFLILFDYIFLHTTKTFHFYLIWIRLEGYYIFKVFKDLPDFCYSKFLQAVQRNETDEFQFFSFADRTISLSFTPLDLNIWYEK